MKRWHYCLLVLTMFVLPLAQAQPPPKVTRYEAPPILNGNILPGSSNEQFVNDPIVGTRYITQRLAPGLANWLIVALLALSVGVLIVGGVMMMISSGESDTKQKAKTMIIWALVGVVIGIISFAIVNFVIGIDFELIE